MTLIVLVFLVGPVIGQALAKWRAQSAGAVYTEKERWKTGIIAGLLFSSPAALAAMSNATRRQWFALVLLLMLGVVWGAICALFSVAVARAGRQPLSTTLLVMRTVVAPPIVGWVAGPMVGFIKITSGGGDNPLVWIATMIAALIFYGFVTVRRLDEQDAPVGFKVALILESACMVLWVAAAILLGGIA